MDLMDAEIYIMIQEADSCSDLYGESNRRDCIIPDNHLLDLVGLYRQSAHVRVVRYLVALFPGSGRNGEEK